MRTYEQRIANIRAKASATQKAYRAMTAAVSTLSILALMVCAFVVFPVFDNSKPNAAGSDLFHPNGLTNAGVTYPFDDPQAGNNADDDKTLPTVPETTPTYPVEIDPPKLDPATAEQVWEDSCIKVHGCRETALEPVVIRSLEALNAYLDAQEMEFTGFEQVRTRAAKYDSFFFEENSLILFACEQSSGSGRLALSEVVLEDNGTVRICVDQIVQGPDGYGTCDVVYWYIFAEVASTECAADRIKLEYNEAFKQENMDFSVKLLPFAYYSGMKGPYVTVIRSVEELLAFSSREAFRDRIAEYDSTFFESNTLVLLYRYESSGGNVNHVRSVTRMSDGSYRIAIDRWPYGVTCDIATWCAAITIPELLAADAAVKADFSVVTDRPIVPQKVGLRAYCDSGPGAFPDVEPAGELVVIRSMAELAAHVGEGSAVYNAYDDDFFTEKTLVIYYRNEPTGMARHEVSEVYREPDGSYTAYINSIYPEWATEDIGFGAVYMQIADRIPENTAFRVVHGSRYISNEEWHQRYGSTQIVLPQRPADTNLEFWIGEYVASVDFSSYVEAYGAFGVRVYLGSGYVSADDPCVIYTVGAFPDESDGGSFIRSIMITDPQIQFYRINLHASNEAFKDLFYSMGYALDERAGTYYAEKDGIIVMFTHGQQIVIRAQVTNREGIIY